MLRALVIDDNRVGAEDPKVAIRLSNLAPLVPTNEAEPLLRRALTIHEKRYGNKHLAVAVDLNQLALSYEAINRLAEAKRLMRRALDILVASALSSEHPTLRAVKCSYARLIGKTGDGDEASK